MYSLRPDAVTSSPMIDLHTHTTPNGYKITIALEELGLEYTAHPVDVRAGEQFAPEIVAMNPNAKIPILVDREAGVTVYESSAILLYLAEKTGRLFPSRDDAAAYWDGVQKLVFAAASIGPMFGQRMHFSYLAPETVPYGIRRYETEAERLQQILETMLEGRDYLLGAEYSIVDIAVFGWTMTAFMVGYLPGETTPNLNAWHERIAAREAVKRGLTVPAARDASGMPPRKTA